MANLQVNISGILSKKFDKTNIGQPYEAQQVIVTTDEEFFQEYPIDMQKNTFPYLDLIEEGASVELSANLRGKKWAKEGNEDKYFLNLTGYKITKK
ncbi:DUF3127 domain-containing protein [Chryseobacterium sp. 5_R23647]|uniref:DUF3127 domain-containing protein n=1 Tax=Chryseobacterium sp. 5_R23647 TaxID=2258964 RepID=UPI000E2393BE|nr:DUF3127 domain-containing protein [Chryseobacterium sp. 5_R23647]REC40480.1 hypothetical protein DRF69_18475 [Chryseobacterium sp. 5_R23647]